MIDYSVKNPFIFTIHVWCAFFPALRPFSYLRTVQQTVSNEPRKLRETPAGGHRGYADATETPTGTRDRADARFAAAAPHHAVDRAAQDGLSLQTVPQAMLPAWRLVALSGKAKSGKTFVSSILMALSFRNQVLSVERIEQKPLHVLWYDTEQSEESTQDILRSRIIPMTGIDESQFPMHLFDIFNVRQDGYARRLPMLEVAVRHYRPDLVVLDGVRDLVADINDAGIPYLCSDRLSSHRRGEGFKPHTYFSLRERR